MMQVRVTCGSILAEVHPVHVSVLLVSYSAAEHQHLAAILRPCSSVGPTAEALPVLLQVETTVMTMFYEDALQSRYASCERIMLS